MPVRSLISQLIDLFGNTGEALRLTERGIWHPTPVRVLAAAVEVIRGQSWLHHGQTVLDAGVGDGRVLAALALGFPDLALRLVGIDCDGDLIAAARRRLATLHPPVHLAQGDFLSNGALSNCDVVFHYPDGSERDLLEHFSRCGRRGARLVVLSPEGSPDLGASPTARLEVRPPGDPVAWTLSTYSAGN